MNGEQHLLDLSPFMENNQQIPQQHIMQIAPVQYAEYVTAQDVLGLKNKLKSTRKQKFSAEEDEKLRSLVAQYGFDWKMISAVMKNRSPRQCRDRWKNYVNPDVNSAPWTTEEDALLVEKFKEYGRQWAIIARYFKQRTDVHIKNRWVTVSHKLGIDPSYDPHESHEAMPPNPEGGMAPEAFQKPMHPLVPDAVAETKNSQNVHISPFPQQ